MFKPYGLDMGTVETKLSSLKNDVTLLFFTRETDCVHCSAAGNLFKRIASVTQKITFTLVQGVQCGIDPTIKASQRKESGDG